MLKTLSLANVDMLISPMTPLLLQQKPDLLFHRVFSAAPHPVSSRFPYAVYGMKQDIQILSEILLQFGN